MKRYLFAITASVFLIMGIQRADIMAQSPDYEKYGNIATTVIREEYPGKVIHNYKYMGRKQIDDRQVLDSFQYKVRVNKKTVIITVQVAHDVKNDRLLNLSVTEQLQQ